MSFRNKTNKYYYLYKVGVTLDVCQASETSKMDDMLCL